MNKCIQTEQEKKNDIEFEKLAVEFENIPVIKQYGENATGMWKRIVDMTRDASVGYDVVKSFRNKSPNVEQLKLMRRVMDREVKNLTKTRGGFAKWLYLPQEIFGDVSFVSNWYNDVQKSNERYKGHTQYFNSQLNNIMNELNTASARAGHKFSKVEKKLVNLYKKYNKARLNGDHNLANTYYLEIDKFVKTGEAKVMSDFHKLVSGTGKDFNIARGTTDANLYKAAEIYRTKVQPKAQEIMIDGLRNYRWALQRNETTLKGYDNYNKLTNKQNTGVLDKIIEKFESKELQKDGYFPVLSFDVLPTLAKASESLFHSPNKNDKATQKEFNKGFNLVNKLEKVINENVYINKNLGKNKLAIEGAIDYNVIPIIDSFIRSATRFNYVAYNSGKYIDVMKDFSETFTKGQRTQLDKKLHFLESYVSDHYGLITGEAQNANPMASSIARNITAFQFASKLGLNVRGALRNSTQSLFNYIWFGATGMNQNRKMFKDQDMTSRVNQGLSNNGILFPEIQEIYGNLNFETKYDNQTGTYKMNIDPTWGKQLSDKLAKTAEKSGFLMTAVENKINRRYTFQLGYGMQWKIDNANRNLSIEFERALKKDLKKNKRSETVEDLKSADAENKFQIFKKNDATEYQYKMEMWRRNRAENQGNAAVNNLHFDYGITGKSKILTKPLGSVAGQFQHYGLNFFNLQRKIVRDGKDAVFSGQWDSAAGWRMYRLGFLYAAVNGLAAPMLNANLGNIIQNDTYERIMNYHDAVLGDDEQKKRAFFGKGPIIGTIGGPFVSDMVSLGNVFQLYEMEEGTWPAYLSGYQDMADQSQDEKYGSLLRILNTQTYRFVNTTLPKMRDGVNLGVVVQGELGLFPDAEIRKKREAIGNSSIGKKLGLQSQKKAKKKSKAQVNYDEDILKSLDFLSN